MLTWVYPTFRNSPREHVLIKPLKTNFSSDHFTTGHVCLEILTQGRSPLLSVKISLFDVFKQILTLHKLTPTSDATSIGILFACGKMFIHKRIQRSGHWESGPTPPAYGKAQFFKAVDFLRNTSLQPLKKSQSYRCRVIIELLARR